MRPTTRPQSALRYPLNHVLGTEASVRVLRVLMLSEIPIGVSELARLAALQPSGVARVCTRLEDLAVIEAVGRGTRNRQFRRASRFPLNDQLVGLFAAERARAEMITQDVRAAVQAGLRLRAAWIEGPVALGTDRPGDAIVVGVLVHPADVEAVRLGLWQRLLSVQQRRDVVVELRVTTMADLETAGTLRQGQLEHVLPLLGAPPLDILRAERGASRPVREPAGKRHAHLDTRSTQIAQRIAERIRRDPSIVEEARHYLDRRILSASPRERLELQEWHDILSTMSIPRLRRFLVQDDARATRLRQSLPFLGVLSAEERRALFARAAKAR